jgi:autotransporter passenger strand-loop-strand repeat protein
MTDTITYVSGAQAQLSGITVSSGATMFVEFGGSISNSVIDPGGFVYAFDGGTVTDVTVSSGGVVDWVGGQIGTLSLQSGGAVITQSSEATSTYIDGDGDLVLASGGTTILDIPLSGEPAGLSVHLQPLDGYVAAVAGSITSVGAGATVQGVTLGVGDLLIVSSGGLASDVTVSGGLIEVLSGGSASGLTVEAQGQLQVSSGGVAISTTVSSGGEEVASAGGLLSASLVGPGGSSLILSGGLESDSTVVATSQTISSGGVEIGLTLDGGMLSNFGQLSGGLIQSGAYLAISSGGAATSVTILGASVDDYGQTTGMVLGSGSIEFVTGGASATTVEAGAAESAFYDAQIAGATILSGGLLSDYEADLSDLSIQAGASLYLMNEWGDWNIVSGGALLSMTIIPAPLEPAPFSVNLTPSVSLTVTDNGQFGYYSLLTAARRRAA